MLPARIKLFLFVSISVFLLSSCGDRTTSDNQDENVHSVVDSSNANTEAGNTTAKSFGKIDTAEYVPGEFLVKFKSEVHVHTAAAANRKIAETGVMATVKRSLSFIGVHHLKTTNPNITAAEAVKILRSNPDVEYAEPNYIYNTPQKLDRGI